MSETLDEALAYAAKDSIWLDRPVHQLRRLKVLAAEVNRLTAENAGEKVELDRFKRRAKLVDALLETYRALTTEPHEAIIEATAQLFDFDVQNAQRHNQPGSK